MSINRRELMMGGAALLGGALFAPRRARAQVARSKRLIVVMARGGWDPVVALDPKTPGAGVEIPAGNIIRYGDMELYDADACNGAVPRYFERHGDVTAVVRGITVASVAHDPCTIRILTGTQTAEAPDLGAISANASGDGVPLPYMVLGARAFTGEYAAQSGRLGSSNQLVTLLDAEKAYPVLDRGRGRPTVSAAEYNAVRGFLENRAQRLRGRRGQYGENRKRLDDYLASLRTADGLRDYSDAFGVVTPALQFTSQIDLALEMIQQEAVWSVSMDTGIDWDTHQNNHADQTANNIVLFDGLTRLVQRLKERPGSMGGRLIDETAVVVLSEMGRTPTLNSDQGKDHWQVTSAMVIGGDVPGGRAFGKSTDTGDPAGVLQSAPVDFATGLANGAGRPLESAQFVAGVLGWSGVDPTEYLPRVEPFMPWVGG